MSNLHTHKYIRSGYVLGQDGANCKKIYVELIGLRNCNELEMCDKILKILFIHQEKIMVGNQLKEENIVLIA